MTEAMKRQLKIKVCGMKFPANRREVEKLPVDFLGFIFYPPSKRYPGKNAHPELFQSAKPGVGVFVDESPAEILRQAEKTGLKYIQLHGKEPPLVCKNLKARGMKVIKTFHLKENSDFEALKPYEGLADFFLFDTKTRLPGGSGKKFNWKILKDYPGKVPFFLSGGIEPMDAEKIRMLDHPLLFGVDLNSGFEEKPGLKNITALETFIDKLKA